MKACFVPREDLVDLAEDKYSMKLVPECRTEGLGTVYECAIGRKLVRRGPKKTPSRLVEDAS